MLRSSKRKLVLQVIALAIVVATIFSLSIWITRNQGVLDTITSYGYIGAFIISVISGFNLVIPIPAASFTPLFLSAGLSLPFLIITISLGMTIADMIGFFIGRTGRTALKETSSLPAWIKSYKDSKNNNFWVIGGLFLYSAFIPLPNELVVIPLALLGLQALPVSSSLAFGQYPV